MTNQELTYNEIVETIVNLGTITTETIATLTRLFWGQKYSDKIQFLKNFITSPNVADNQDSLRNLWESFQTEKNEKDFVKKGLRGVMTSFSEKNDEENWLDELIPLFLENPNCPPEILKAIFEEGNFNRKVKVSMHPNSLEIHKEWLGMHEKTVLSVTKLIKRGTELSQRELEQKQTTEQTKIHLIRAQNLSDNRITGSIYLSSMPEKKGIILKENDLILTRANSKVALALYEQKNNDIQSYADQNLVVIRCDQDQLNSKYLFYYFQSECGKTILESFYTQGSRIKNLGIKEMKQKKIVIPELEEQGRVVKELSAIDVKIKEFYQKLAEVEKTKLEKLQNLF